MASPANSSGAAALAPASADMRRKSRRVMPQSQSEERQMWGVDMFFSIILEARFKVEVGW